MKVTLSKIAVFTAIAVMSVSAQNMKFPQQKSYKGCIKPTVSQSDMDTQIKAIYDDYKNRFRKTMNTPSGGYYFSSPSTDGTGLTVSEAHGWGMVITVMMAGYDSEAKKVFDGMVKVFDHYKTNQSGPNLMSWKINSDGDSYRTSSATDGDLDIAYALLLAFKQWGDQSYKTKALQVLQDIKQYNINQNTNHVLLGNWATTSETTYKSYNYTRPSDWMGGHFRTFAEADVNNKAFWNGVADKIYTVYSKFQEQPYAKSGLISDFVHFDGTTANSAPVGFLSSHGEKNVDRYATNAARVPWRMAADFALSSSTGAKDALTKLNSFIDSKVITLSYQNVKEGYNLDGSPLSSNAGGAAYLAPFVAARIATTNTQSLTDGWNSLRNTPVNDAYQAAIRLQSMLLISGNWWHYNDQSSGVVDEKFDTAGVYLDQFADVKPQSDLERGFGEEKIPAAPWEGGNGWAVETWKKGLVKTSAGNDWVFEKWDGDKLTEKGNMDQVFVNGYLKAKFQDSSAIYVNFPNKDKNFDNTDWFDLSAMTGFTIKGKGTGTLTVVFLTDTTGKLDSKEKFWGGYATTVTLDGTDKPINILSALLAARPYSQEATNLWSWKDNGSKKVSGISLVADKAMDIEIDYIKINGKDIKNETFGFSSPLPPITGTNVAKLGVWDVYADPKSKGTAVVKDTTVAIMFNRADGAGTWGTYVTASGVFSTGGTNFDGLKTIQFSYDSDQDIMVTLPMSDAKGNMITGGDIPAHGLVLPKGKGQSFTKPIADFKQPKWYLDTAKTPVAFDLKLTNNISFALETSTDAATVGELLVKSLILDGVTVKATSLTSVVGTAKTAGFSAVRHESGVVLSSLNLPHAGTMNLQIMNLQGRVIASVDQNMVAGLNAIALNVADQASGVYFLTARGTAGVFTQKIVLR